MPGSSSGRGPGSLPGRAALWVREFGDSSSFSRDAHGRRVHLAVCNFVGLCTGHLAASVTPGCVPGSTSAGAAEVGMPAGRSECRRPRVWTQGCVLGSLQSAASPLACN